MAWSPDGRALFHDGATAAGSRQLFRVPASGGTPRALTRAEGNATIGNQFDVSPDGAQVAYSYQVSGWAFFEVVPADGGTPRRFSTDTTRVWEIEPRWSPDGGRITVSYWNYETDLPNLLVLPATGGAGHRLPAAPDQAEFNPQWTPDGRSLVYQSAHSMIRYVTADVSRVLAATP